MTELLQWLHKDHAQTPQHIGTLNEPVHYLGLTVKSYIRFVYFEYDCKEQQYIGFNNYNIAANKLYLIPSLELYYLPHTVKGFHCVCMPLNSLNTAQKQLLFSLYYKDNKGFEIGDNYLHILQSHYGKTLPAGIIFEILKEHACITNDNASYLANAEEFYQLLSGGKITHKMAAKDIVPQMGILTKTLERVCNSIFKWSPGYILRYHLLSKCIFMLLYYKEDTIANIADRLEFTDTVRFNKFIKALTNRSPGEIRIAYNYLFL